MVDRLENAIGSASKRLQNVDLWKEMDIELAKHEVEWLWVKVMPETR